MRKSFFYFVLLFGFIGFSQTYEFHTVTDIETSPVISQDRTGACWSFGTTSFLESEIIHSTGKKIDLSEMFTVRNIYLDKAENYILSKGKTRFGEGGLAHDAINSIRKYGIVEQRNYTGKVNPNSQYNHEKMRSDLLALLKKVVSQTPENYPDWKTDYNAILDRYMGKINPETKTDATVFMAENKINLDDYINLTSFTNQPSYSKFILDIPDNFAKEEFYNLPLDELIQNIDNALDKGYTLTISIDNSEPTFSEEIGIAVIPKNENDTKAILKEIKPEKKITPEFRQKEFENYNTTDDHLMHIVGKVADQKGNHYYKVKNSWGDKIGKQGYYYMSISYVSLKAICILLNKNGLTQKTKTALGL
jgi:bleomycin hydrolase